MELQDDNYCFACGVENPIGLKMKFEFSGNDAVIRFTPRREHQGWSDIIHGGILSTLMDEAMARVIIHHGENVVTSRMDMRFLRPASIGDELTIVGTMEKSEDTNITASAKILNKAGKCISSARGVYVRVKG